MSYLEQHSKELYEITSMFKKMIPPELKGLELEVITIKKPINYHVTVYSNNGNTDSFEIEHSIFSEDDIETIRVELGNALLNFKEN